MGTYNAPDELQGFIDYLEDYSQYYATDQLLILFGSDFEYEDAFVNYENIDRMIKYFNENESDRYIFKYSTPSEYFDAINKIEDHEWPTKFQDNMPLVEPADSAWTGFFSSRPNSKSQVRMGSHQLHAFDQLASQSMLDQNLSEEDATKYLEATQFLKEQMGVLQHHDAIAGTAKQAVADDYRIRIAKGVEITGESYADIIDQRVKAFSGYTTQNSSYQMCHTTNGTFVDCPISDFDVTEGKETFIAVHNPSSIPMKTAKVSLPSGNFVA